MKQHPHIFTAQQMQAINDGRLSQFRVLVKPQPEYHPRNGRTLAYWNWFGIKAPHQVGDILAIHEVISRELCPCQERPPNPLEGMPGVTFKDVTPPCETCDDGWIVKTRDTGERREVVGVRCERMQEISEEDAEAEGITVERAVEVLTGQNYIPHSIQVGAFKRLWQSIYPGSWERNDWVFVYEFKVVSGWIKANTSPLLSI
ncbi:hypothetical protein LCGC14_1678220 [marine sediment metagenome]|uniref:ASCH domain-containing protein n=1 Tax=marine sediment metagenome TaxID=412755 RepID=A0A0F9K540_9ZZZZ